ncbi:MAG: hypothetical protein HGA54_04290 [Actinobacteria bacterium]|nr:hypothetical protein [Actinomycetota bacterium]
MDLFLLRSEDRCGGAIDDTREILFDYDARRVDTIRQHEQVLDSLNHEISAFLSRLAHTTQNPEVGLLIPGLLQTVADLEHIGDACEEILERIVERKEEHVFFTEDAMGDLKRLASRVGTCVARLEEHFAGNPVHSGESLLEIKSDSRAAFDAIRQSHYERICSGACSPRMSRFAPKPARRKPLSGNFASSVAR